MAAMIAFLVVVAALVAGINILNALQMTGSADRTAEDILEYEEMTADRPEEERPPITEMAWTGGPEEEFTTRFFVVHCDEEGNLNVLGNDYIFSVDEELAEQYTKSILDRRKQFGYYKDYRFRVEQEEDGLTVVFLNVAEALKFRKTLLLVSILIGLISLAAVFVLVIAFSRPAIRPYIKNIERQKQFITDAGHELKTPITTIATSADIAAMEHEDDEWIANIQRQTVRLSHLVNDLIALSRLDEEVPYPDKAEFSLSEAAWEIAEPVDALAKAKGIHYTRRIEERLTLFGDRDSVQQMLSLLLENALKYTDRGGEIRLHIYHSRGKNCIEVYNTCDIRGIDNLDRLFDRFYRPDDSRSRGTGGAGIGLSIARAVAENHNGRISASTEDHRSILFTVIL